MTFLLGIIMGPLGKALAALVAMAAVFFAGTRQAAQRAKIKGLEADKKANERINDADVSTGDADADTKWLRERSGK